MDSVVGVLCARVKVEEKWLIETLVEAGVAARPFPPTSAPLPIGPLPTGPLATAVAGGVATEATGVVIDRCADRVVASALVPILRAMETHVIDAGLAATGNRLSIASRLSAAGIPRPVTLLATSEAAGLTAVGALGFPSTLLPLDGGAAEIPLLDRDIAEAVLEHRDVLGDSGNVVALIQAGARSSLKLVELLVIGGRVAAMSDGVAGIEVAELAQATATALQAAMLGVTVAMTAAGPVVWDVQAVPRFRDLLASGRQAIASAMLELVESARTRQAVRSPLISAYGWSGKLKAEVAGGVVFSA